MTSFFILALLATTFTAISTSTTTAYDTKYDNIDLDEVLTNERLLKNYVNCLMGEGPCSPDGQELKSKKNPRRLRAKLCFYISDFICMPDTLPDAIQSDCSMCSEKQKLGAEKVTHYLIDNKPDDWARLANLYDKDGEYKAKYLSTKANNNNSSE